MTLPLSADEVAPVRGAPPVSPEQTPVALQDRRLRVQPSDSAGPRQTIDNPLLTFDDTVTRDNMERTELAQYVYEFAIKSGLIERYQLLLFGARFARDPHEALEFYRRELTKSEIAMIEREADQGDGDVEPNTGFWHQSKFFRATIITASLGGTIQGWTQSVNNGTINGMPQEFGLCIDRSKCSGKTADLWTLGMLNAIPLISAAVFGTTLADPLQEYYLGRRGSIMVSCCITLAATIAASTTHTVAELAICRAINGIALGAKASIVPIYSAELSPEHIRGAILANWQLADAAGIFFGFMVNLVIISYVSESRKSWRILTNTVLIPTIPLLIMIYLMPESPRYRMKHGQYNRALAAFESIQTSPLLASRDFMYAHAQLDFESRLLHENVDGRGHLAERIVGRGGVAGGATLAGSASPAQPAQNVDSATQPGERDVQRSREISDCNRNVELADIAQHSTEGSNENLSSDIEDGGSQVESKENPYFYHIGVEGYFKRLGELWSNKRCRRALLSASIAMTSQQMTGINTIAFLGTVVWQGSLKGTENDTTNDKFSAIIGLAFGASNYIFGLPAYWLSDKVGRSILLAIGLPNMAWSMLVFALLFQIPGSSPSRTPMISIFAIIFTMFYAPTAGTSPFSISAEVFPLVSREVGMAVSVAINLMGAGILVLVFPFVYSRIGATGSLSIFAGLNIVAFVLVYLFVPETRRRTLEELQYTFDLSTRWHVEYRLGYVRKEFQKNWWKYLFARKQVEPLVPFYEWARIAHPKETGEE